MAEEFVNRVAASGLITLDLETFLPGDVRAFDLKDHLFMGLLLKEKDFRQAMKDLDWSLYEGRDVAVHCSTDAIVPAWAYMLLAAYLQPRAARIHFGTPEEAYKLFLLQNIEALDTHAYIDARVVVKGCGDKEVPAYAYAAITQKLLPVVKTVMYGEPCSTVPVWKKR